MDLISVEKETPILKMNGGLKESDLVIVIMNSNIEKPIICRYKDDGYFHEANLNFIVREVTHWNYLNLSIKEEYGILDYDTFIDELICDETLEEDVTVRGRNGTLFHFDYDHYEYLCKEYRMEEVTDIFTQDRSEDHGYAVEQGLFKIIRF